MVFTAVAVTSALFGTSATGISIVWTSSALVVMEDDMTGKVDDSEANCDCELPAAATGITRTGLDGAPWAVEASTIDGVLSADWGTEVEAWELVKTSDCFSMVDVFSTRARANWKQVIKTIVG